MIGHKRIEVVKQAVIKAVQETASQRVSLVAAGCAFYAILALFPSITMLISVYGLAFNPHTVQPQLHYLEGLMPPDVYLLISERVQSLVSQPIKGLGLSFLISLLISLWSSSTGTKSVLNALTLAYGETETRGFIRFHLVSLGMTFLAVLGVIVAIAFMVLLPIVMAHIGAHIRLPENMNFWIGMISFLVMVCFIVIALGLLYRFGPSGDGRVFFVPGAAVATLAWLATSWGFGVYVGRFAAYSATYGPLATLIGLMMWFYISAYVVLFGAHLNAALDQQRKVLAA